MEAQERLCTVQGCGRVHNARGYCRMHYKRFKRTGSTELQDHARGVCGVDKCGKPHDSRGLCQMHRWRLIRTGSLELRELPLLVPHGPAAATSGIDGECIVWDGFINPAGYGQTVVEGKTKQVHRLEWEKQYGMPEKELRVDHICRNRACYNIAHLRLTTPKENAENRAYKRADGMPVGVSYRSESGRWRVRVVHNGRIHHGGSYTSLEEAAGVARNMRNVLFTHNELDREPLLTGL